MLPDGKVHWWRTDRSREADPLRVAEERIYDASLQKGLFYMENDGLDCPVSGGV